MGTLTLQGSTSGQITIAPPAVAGTNTLTLPAATDTVTTNAATQTLTNKTLTSPNIGGTPVMNASVITSGTSQASTSGTSIDFTSIPSWVKRITIMLYGVSTSGTANVTFQLGTGATPTYTTSGYLGTAVSTSTATPTATQMSSGWFVNAANAAEVRHGSLVLTNISGNIWVGSGVFGSSNTNFGQFVGGSVSLSGVLTAVRITTSNGTDTFDAGSINIMWE